MLEKIKKCYELINKKLRNNHIVNEKMRNMMLEVATTDRQSLLKFQKNAFTQVESAQKQPDFNNLMFSIMNLAFWLRADLELLMRVAYWQDLSEDDFGARFLADQLNFYEVTLKRMGIDKAKTEVLLGDLKQKADDKRVAPTRPEANDKILERLAYRKVELNKLFACFHKALSKVAHPDPFFMCFPDEYRHQIENNLMSMFGLCKSQLDAEWGLLESHLKATS